MFAYPVPADGKAWIVAATTFRLKKNGPLGRAELMFLR